MGEHLVKYGFTPDYIRWIFHGKAHRMRDEAVRQHIDECDADGRIGDMLDNYEEAHFSEGPQEEEPKATKKVFYEMLEAAQKPLHGQTKVSQLDGIGCLMALKSQFGLSRDAFDSMLTVFCSMLPEDHILPKTMYQMTKILSALKMHMSRYILVLMGASYLGKSTRLKLIVQNAKPQDSWRWMLVTVSLRGSSRFL